MTQNLLPVDRDGRTIHAGDAIAHIDNVTINASTYTKIAIPADTYCKAVLLKTRGANAFRLALSASPSAYITFSGQVSLNIDLRSGETLGWIRGDTAGDTLEIMYLD
jgi:hypothetical protein